MKKTRTITLLTAFVAVTAYLGVSSCDDKKVVDKKKEEIVVADSTKLSPILPFDVTLPDSNFVLETTVRRSFDLFSWQSFIAINWPASGKSIIGEHGDNPTVWETWKKNYETFLENGEKPAPWNIMEQSKQLNLSQTGKTPDNLLFTFQPFLTGPLIDQNGKYARFEIAMNKEMFDYIDTNTLYNIEGQIDFKGKIDFPEGNNTAKTQGAVMVKASWKILGKGDDTSRFHKIKAIVHVAALPSRGIKASSYETWVGLVGLHIGTKTNSSPQWIWSTFEQVDNAPDFGKAANDAHYNFYNHAAGEKALNKAPAQPWNPGIKGQIPTQVTRLTPIDEGTKALNDSIRKVLIAVNPKTVWQYYQLIGTQWPVHPKASNTGDPFPVYMANATLETYDQGSIKNGTIIYSPGVTSSCIGCHNASVTWGGRTADFTYLLKSANASKK